MKAFLNEKMKSLMCNYILGQCGAGSHPVDRECFRISRNSDKARGMK